MSLVGISVARDGHLPRESAHVPRHITRRTLSRIASISAFSSGVIVTPAAAIFSSVRAVLLEPGMGMTCERERVGGCCFYVLVRLTLSDRPMIYANASCAGVTPFFSAISF